MSYQPPAVPDENVWTAGTSPFTPEGGVFNDSAAALTSGQQGTGRQTPNRARHANLRNQAGTEIATAANPLRTDPTGTTKQPVTLFDAAGNAITSTGGALNVNLSTGLANPLPTTDAADGSTGAAVPAKAILAGGSDGTNLRALALDTSGRQKVLLFDAAGNAITSTSSALDENFKLIGGTAVDVNSGNKSAGTQRVVLATDQPALTTPLPENQTQLAGTAIDVNSGNKSAGTQRVVLATDQPLLTNICEQVTTSGDTIRRRFVADLHQSTLFSLTNAFHTFLTGSPRYFIQNVNIQLDPLMTFAGGGSVVVILSDTTDGTIFQWFMYLPNAAAAPAVASNYVLNTPPDFFYKATTNTSALQIKVNVNPTGSNFCVNLAYGFTSL